MNDEEVEAALADFDLELDGSAFAEGALVQYHRPQDLALGWELALLAMSVDKERPGLQTVWVEAFTEGTRLSCTDTVMAFQVWVPHHDWALGASGILEDNGVAESPLWTALVRDPGKRALALLKYGSKIDLGQSSLGHVVRMGCVPAEEEGVLPGMESPDSLVFELDETERVVVAGYEGDFPALDRLISGFVDEPQSLITGTERTFGALSKICKLTEVLPHVFLGERSRMKVKVDLVSGLSFAGIIGTGVDAKE